MKPGGGRLKGNAYERVVAKLIIKAAGKDFAAKDCYRTPRSGGHPHAGKSDLIMSKPLRKRFPFCVECKDRGNWRVEKMFIDARDMYSYVRQSRKSAREDRYKRIPMVVIKGKRTSNYAAAPMGLLTTWAPRLVRCSHFTWEHKTKTSTSRWMMVLLSDVLRELRRNVDD